MSETPGEHLEEEPQKERGPEGSRDEGGGGPVDRPAGRAEDDHDTKVDPDSPDDPNAPDLQSGGG